MELQEHKVNISKVKDRLGRLVPFSGTWHYLRDEGQNQEEYQSPRTSKK